LGFDRVNARFSLCVCLIRGNSQSSIELIESRLKLSPQFLSGVQQTQAFSDNVRFGEKSSFRNHSLDEGAEVTGDF